MNEGLFIILVISVFSIISVLAQESLVRRDER